MPKLLILFHATGPTIARLADAVADGARSVRFAEVDVRRVVARAGGAVSDDAVERPDAGDESTASIRELESSDALAGYDGIIVGTMDSSGAETDPVMAQLTATSGSLVNKVASAFTPSGPEARRRATLWAVLTPMANRGMILVPPSFDASADDELEAARRQGKRVADVVGWITHARSHHHHH